MKKVMHVIFSVVMIAALAGCAGSVRRISSDEVVDLSGRWNDTDSQLVAEEMVKDSLSKPWLARFLKKAGKNPTVIVGTIKNKTDEHIAVDTFKNDIERELINNGSVDFVTSKGERAELRAEREDQQLNASQDTKKEMYAETGADYMLQGTISKITDATYGKKTFYYQVDMTLTDLKTGKKVWIGDKKIKKFIQRPGARI